MSTRAGVVRRRRPCRGLTFSFAIGALYLLITASGVRTATASSGSGLSAEAAATDGMLGYQRSGDSEHMIVGVIIRGEEVGSIDLVRRRGTYLLPLREFIGLSGADLEVLEDGVEIKTSLGDVVIPNDQLEQIDGRWYVSERVLEDRFVTRLEFDFEQFAVRLNVPWVPIEEAEPEKPTPEVQPDALPPSASLSRLRVDVQQTRYAGESSSVGDALLGGRVGGGRWMVRANGADDEDPQIQDYAWLGSYDRALLQIGHQRLSLHSLLPSVELTGVQLGWTNEELDEFERDPTPGLLLTRSRSSGVIVQGKGPPAGLAQLRIDGVPVDRQVIGLDGFYEFPDVILPTGRLTRIEVYLFDRSNFAVPVEIHDASQSTWDLLLGEGAVVHQGGVGLRGNLLNDAISDAEEPSELAGFYQGRFGLTDRLTVETAFQQDGERTQALAGVVTRFGRSLLTSLAAGASDDAFGYEAVIESVRLPWRFLGQSTYAESGFSSEGSKKRYDHWLEVGYQPSSRLDISLMGRRRKDGVEQNEYVLPALSWYPAKSLNIRARPNAEGDYRFDAFWYLGESFRASSSWFDDTTATSLQYRFPDRRHQMVVTTELTGSDVNRYSAIVSRTRLGRWSTTWDAGVTHERDSTGVVARTTVPLMPGVLLGAEYVDPAPFSGKSEPLVLIKLTMDLTYSRGRFLAADSVLVRDDVGSLVGRVSVESPESYEAPKLDGVLIELDRRPAVRTEADGSYFVGNLPPGVYRVYLDAGELPIELTPDRTKHVVEIAAGASTRLDFVVRPRFGIAGRITDADSTPIVGALVEILDDQGQVVGEGRTDRFGLYRVDDLGVGFYHVRVAPRSLQSYDFEAPTRELEITDDYLFGQDLVVPIVWSEPTREPSE